MLKKRKASSSLLHRLQKSKALKRSVPILTKTQSELPVCDDEITNVAAVGGKYDTASIITPSVFSFLYDALPAEVSKCIKIMEFVRKVCIKPIDTFQSASLLHPDVPLITEKDFGPDYEDSMVKIRNDLDAACIQRKSHRSILKTQLEYIHLLDKHALILGDGKSKKLVTKEGKIVTMKGDVCPNYPRRMNLFIGGNVYFSYPEWPNIFIKRAQDIESLNFMTYSNDFAYCNEGICAFFELDIISKNIPLSDEKALQLGLCCQDIMKEYYYSNPDTDFRMWILTCLPKPKKDDNEADIKVIKSGIHVIFPNITINAIQGRQLCTSLDLRLEKKFGLSNIVDDAPYKDAGTTLRPAYAMKVEECYSCDEFKDVFSPCEMMTKRQNCDSCLQNGAVGGGSVYKPKFLINSDGEFLRNEFNILISEHLPLVMFETSIVSPSQCGFMSPGFFKPDIEPLYISVATLKSNNSKDKSFVFKSDRKVMSQHTRGYHEIITNQPILDLLLQIVRSYHTCYKSTTLSRVIKKKLCYIVNICGSGQSFCRICKKQGHQHKSNSVWFKILYKNREIIQQCFDKDCTKLVAQDPSISKYLSHNYSISESLSLFPEHNKVHKVMQKVSDAQQNRNYQIFLDTCA